MKKLINNPENFVKDTMTGIIAAYGDKVKLLDGDERILVTNYPVADGKVGIVTAGGSGHLPVFLGYVGDGMLDGCAIGNVFASPSASKMDFDMACEMVEMDDVETRTVRVKDDVASSPKETKEKRRGVAGMVYAFKVAGAAAAQMKNLDEVAGVAQKALDHIRTMGVALTPCIVPQVGEPTFSIADDEIEIGMGIHGEKGIEVRKMMTADEVADILVERITADMPLVSGDEVSVMVNGLGATPLEEQLIVYGRVHKLLEDKGVKVFMPHVGEFATSMEMAGLSLTIFKLDEELKALLAAPAKTPFYTNYNK